MIISDIENYSVVLNPYPVSVGLQPPVKVRATRFLLAATTPILLDKLGASNPDAGAKSKWCAVGAVNGILHVFHRRKMDFITYKMKIESYDYAQAVKVAIEDGVIWDRTYSADLDFHLTPEYREAFGVLMHAQKWQWLVCPGFAVGSEK